MRELNVSSATPTRQHQQTFEETFAAAARNFEELAAICSRAGAVDEARARGRRAAAGARGRRGPAEAAERRERSRTRPRSRSAATRRTTPGRDRDHPGRQGDQAPDPALRWREVDDRDRLPVRGLPRPPVPVLHPRRGRGRARRSQHRSLPDLLRAYSGRAQFIVVTHQKRTMEAADSLYGVSMARRRRVEGGVAPAAAARRRLGPADAAGRGTARRGGGRAGAA